MSMEELKLEERIKVVIVHHQNDARQYAFKVPRTAELNPGDMVLCDTAMGKDQVGYCITPAYIIQTDLVNDLLHVQPNKMKTVKGRLVPRYYDEMPW